MTKPTNMVGYYKPDHFIIEIVSIYFFYLVYQKKKKVKIFCDRFIYLFLIVDEMASTLNFNNNQIVISFFLYGSL